ncbi:hypothetical protein BD749_0465 [Pontibacter ramchanderi]|uniref:Glycosyltransferase subfamily 4-like N-terminal domain-containing protein n=2 Tax=Pontibacter ramchanderi TaxID=1179743 RepID=A0A2N3V1R1_9BACT|nr:hypothetical protein BD749_0465 [Pontibacter ramchanderi]
MKLLSYQPFSLYSNSGGSRILRRLYQGYESQVNSLVLEANYWTAPKGLILERTVAASPQGHKYYRWYVRTCVTWLREKKFRLRNINRVQKEAANIEHDIIHVINHGPFSGALCKSRIRLKKQLWVSFHDHFSTTGSTQDDARELWKQADRRLVISNALGVEYSRLFGYRNFEIITDGVKKEELSIVNPELNDELVIYFAGLLHLEYLPLFKALAEALDLLVRQGLKIKLVLRGTQQVSFLKNRLFAVEYKSVSFDEKELKEELDAAAILYLPIKFSPSEFSLYSLSTKMVGYLSSSGAILYHGPENGAACLLLQETGSAECCTSLNVQDLTKAILSLINHRQVLSENAKHLAERQFNILDIQKRFWLA